MTETRSKRYGTSSIEYEHPSYGMIQFSRTTGCGRRRRLFGSSIRDHVTQVRMTITPAKLEHSLHHDRVYSAGNRPLIEIDMSAAQFAELITTLNYGAGVPCTITHFNGKQIDDPPDIETEVERVNTEFENSLGEMIAKMGEYRSRIEKLCDKLPEKRREEIRIALGVMENQLSSNVPFIMSQFSEATDRVTAAAKSEIEAFTMHAVTSAGLDPERLEALDDKHSAPALPEVEDKADPNA